MYNHARTLLLNADGDAAAPDWAVGEEAVPAAYRAVALPSYLADVRSRLFGTRPDRSYLNYRLAQYLRLAHATELDRHLRALDPRVTYLGRDRNDLFGDAAFAPRVLTAGGGVRPLVVQGDPPPPDATGESYYAFTVTQQDADTVEVRQRSPRPKSRFLDVTLSGGLSTAAVPLGDSGLGAFVPSAPTGTAWDVSFHARPARDPGVVLADCRATLGEPTLLRLFGAAPAEPYLTFRNLFWDHRELPHALGGLLLAVAYRTDEIYRQVPRG